jgi:catechol 2,3-dioxygenase-like lactoylglutathione lyase family enzyme
VAVLGFDHLAITVDDVERTIRFYTGLLGADTCYLDRFRSENFPVVTLIVGTNRINVHPAPPRTPLVARQPTPGSVDLCFRWGGPIEEVVALLARHGVPMVEGPVPREASDGRAATSVYVRDPDGNLVEFLSTD